MRYQSRSRAYLKYLNNPETMTPDEKEFAKILLEILYAFPGEDSHAFLGFLEYDYERLSENRMESRIAITKSIAKDLLDLMEKSQWFSAVCGNVDGLDQGSLYELLHTYPRLFPGCPKALLHVMKQDDVLEMVALVRKTASAKFTDRTDQDHMVIELIFKLWGEEERGDLDPSFHALPLEMKIQFMKIIEPEEINT